ncbi:MAG: hypothetical protein QOC92_1983 [Acidimicrobiaceae bacterium]|jgi:hypothetical protein
MKITMAKTTTLQSRAVLRSIEAGSSATCVTCDEQVKFRAKVKLHQVICNVYVDGKWNRVEHYHLECYSQAGEPYGTPVANAPTRVSSAA